MYKMNNQIMKNVHLVDSVGFDELHASIFVKLFIA